MCIVFTSEERAALVSFLLLMTSCIHSVSDHLQKLPEYVFKLVRLLMLLEVKAVNSERQSCVCVVLCKICILQLVTIPSDVCQPVFPLHAQTPSGAEREKASALHAAPHLKPHFSRPGSAYVLQMQPLAGVRETKVGGVV